MSTLTRLSAAQLTLAEILATKCECGHPLSSHPRTALDGTRCRHYDVIAHPMGYKHGNAKFVYCKCKEFRDVPARLPV